jgi:hypothetical protein
MLVPRRREPLVHRTTTVRQDFNERLGMQTLDEMRSLHLLTPDQHARIGAWIAERKTPEAIMQMPPHLWRAFALASMLMGFDADVTQPPLLES